MTRHYKLRTKQQRYDDMIAHIARLEVAHNKRYEKIGKLREEAQALANVLAQQNKPVEAPPNG